MGLSVFSLHYIWQNSKRCKENYGALGLGESLFVSAPVREGFVRGKSDQREFDFDKGKF